MGVHSKSIPRWVFLLAAALWVVTNLRAVSTICFDWDAAQLSLATIEFSLADHQPHPPVTAAKVNRSLRDKVELLQPAEIICTSRFQDAPPNRRSVEYDFRELTGSGGPIYLTLQEASGPEGTQRVFEGEGFAIWR